MAKPILRFRLLVEDFDRNVNTEVTNIINYWRMENCLVVQTKDEGNTERTETFYPYANFRTLTVEPFEVEGGR